ncbi:hypothetical protein V3N99_20055 [Dermatophilaceae bacterium Soc4.6]
MRPAPWTTRSVSIVSRLPAPSRVTWYESIREEYLGYRRRGDVLAAGFPRA